MKFIKRLFVLATVLLCTPALAQAQAMKSNLVLLKVNPSGTALEYNASGSNHGMCVTSSTPGCVRVTGDGNQQVVPSIKFKLVGAPGCGAGQWELDRVEIGGENSSDKPGQFGGLNSRAATDFRADPGTGLAATGTSPDGGLILYDANSVGSPYWVYYRVWATCAGDSSVKPIVFDPRAENDGTGL